ncbi:MAG: FtsX-like permease family protein [bacterium]|nr:FtsX-like permease family protein [bacterium]
MKHRKKPPPLLVWLLKRFLQIDEEYEKLGDFEESYIEVSEQKGKLIGAVWYIIQIVKAVPSFISNSIHRSSAMIKNYVTIAVRNLIRNKTYSILNIGGLAVGIAVFIMIGLYVQFELSYEKHHAYADRIYTIASGDQAVTPNPLAEALAEDFPEVEAATRLIGPGECVIRYKDKQFNGDNWCWADENIFDVFTFEIVSGDNTTALRDPYTVIISEKIAEKYFEGEDPIGKVITRVMSDKSYDFIVSGVMKNNPENSYIKADIFGSLITQIGFMSPRDSSWGNYFCHTFFRLSEGSDPYALQEKYPEWTENKHNNRSGRNFHNIPLLDMHLKSSDLIFHFSPVNDIRYVYLFSAVAIIIILIAGINYINLSTAQAAKRVREVGIRKVNGAHRSQLLRQFLSESVLLTLVSLSTAVVLTYLMLPLFNSLVEPEEVLTISNNIYVLMMLLGTGLLIGIAAGSYPAFFVSGFKLSNTLKGSSSTNTKNAGLRNILVVVQFTISIFLIISTIVTSNQLNFIKNKDLGFTKDHIVLVSLGDPAVNEKRQAFKEELLKYPEITDISYSTTVPMKIDWHNSFYFRNETDPDNNDIMSHYTRVDYDYVDVFDLEIVKGRNFSRELDEGENVYIINEFIANQLGWDDPIGKAYTNQREIGHVVGVVKNFHNENMHIPIGPVTLCLRPERGFITSIKLNTDDIQGTISGIENIWNQFSSGYPFDYEFMDEKYDNMYKTEMRLGNTLNYFSVLAIFICCLGLFGLASFTVEQSTKEIGIRKALGASIVTIIKMLSWKFLKWTVIANIIAWPIAYYYMNKWLQGFVYRVNIGWDVFAIAAFTALSIAFLTVISRTMKAALANPTDSLRYE